MLKIFDAFFSRPKADVKELVKEGAMIVDVRTPEEFREGHIKGSLNIPLDSIRSKIPQLKKEGKKIITVCRSGNRSAMAKSLLSGSGIDATNGGAWQELQHRLS